jgi:hypothetical protein
MNPKSAVFMGIGFELLILILGAAYLGDKIDQHYHWKGYATVTLIIVCLISWFYHLIVLLQKFSRDEEDPS